VKDLAEAGWDNWPKHPMSSGFKAVVSLDHLGIGRKTRRRRGRRIPVGTMEGPAVGHGKEVGKYFGRRMETLSEALLEQ
jgi:hypothetical protein